MMSEKFIGSYKVLDKIGAGGMATVYLAVHQDVPNLRVVLKLLSDPRMVERFRAEADKLALLDGHANICQIKHFFNHGDEFAIAMEYIDGTPLDEVIKKQGRMPVAEAVRVVADVLGTLQFAHERGICHRDIKPGNLMLDKQHRVKIIDFGIAKAETDPNLTVAGSSCGTPTYMAPEQFNPSEKTDYVLTDIYAVGTTLYYLLTGELPFKGDNAFALRDAKMFSDPVRPREINKEIPSDLEKITLKALAKNPEDRFSSAGEMQKALEASRMGAEQEKVGSPERAATAILQPAPKRKRRAGFRPIFAVVGVAGLAIAAYFIFSPGGPAKPLQPNLLAPDDGAAVTTSTPTLRWRTTAGEDGFYELIYADNAEFVDPKTIGGLVQGEYTWNKPLPEGRYFWQVRAMNRDRVRSEFSAAFSFVVPSSVAGPLQGQLSLSISPSGDVYLNDRLQGRDQSSLDLALDTGRYVLRVENSGSIQKAFTDTLTLTAETSVSKDYRFTFAQPKPRQPVEEYGYLRIGSKPALGAEIIIDGVAQPHVTPYRFKLKTGSHIITAILLSGDRQLSKTDTVTVIPGSDEKYVFEFEE